MRTTIWGSCMKTDTAYFRISSALTCVTTSRHQLAELILPPETGDGLAKRMTPAQIAEAQDLARECVAKNYKGC